MSTLIFTRLVPTNVLVPGTHFQILKEHHNQIHWQRPLREGAQQQRPHGLLHRPGE